jgi:trehalose synthase
VSLVTAVEVPRRPVSLLEPIVGGQRHERLVEAADQVRRLVAGRTIWNVNSTATGGGVAEMLQVQVGYVNDLDIPIGWLVVAGDAEFFAITKRGAQPDPRRSRRRAAGPGGGPSLHANADRQRRRAA